MPDSPCLRKEKKRKKHVMQVIRWSETTAPGEQELCRRMRQAGLSPYSWSNAPGDTYAVHSHSYEKVLYCVRGSICFVLPDQATSGQRIDLAPGDCLILAPGIRHSAYVGPRGVTCLEATRQSLPSLGGNQVQGNQEGRRPATGL